MNRNRSERVSDTAVLVTIGAVLAVGTIVWLWGGLAGAVFGHGWPRVETGQLLSVLTRLPGRLSDPGAAWPASVRAGLPGPGGFYAALAMVALLLGAVALPVMRIWRRGPVGATRTRWGAPADEQATSCASALVRE